MMSSREPSNPGNGSPKKNRQPYAGRLPVHVESVSLDFREWCIVRGVQLPRGNGTSLPSLRIRTSRVIR